MSCPAEPRVVVAGREAERVLAGGRRARVIARFERSVYVANARGLACLGDERLGPGPLNASLVPGATLPALGARLAVSLRGTRRWRPPALAPMDRARLRRGIRALDLHRGRGLFAVRGIHPGCVALREWLSRGAAGRAPRAVAALIGAGPGLTPAGDDLLGGTLVALRAARRHALASRLGRWALARARGRTNRISRAHLRCAAQGEGGAALHAFVAALAAGGRLLEPALARLDAIGHTSGWDAAAGAALALDIVSGSG